LWSNGQTTDLGNLGGNISAAIGINNKRQVVGFGNTTGNGGLNHGFIWEDGKMADLNSLIPADCGWFLQQVSGINDRGQIVGQGIKSATGQNHAFLLNPMCGSSQRIRVKLSYQQRGTKNLCEKPDFLKKYGF